jgi:hypothetical protein
MEIIRKWGLCLTGRWPPEPKINAAQHRPAPTAKSRFCLAEGVAASPGYQRATANGRREHAAIGEPADDSGRGRGPVTATATQMSKGADRRAANARTLAVAVPRTIDGATH